MPPGSGGGRCTTPNGRFRQFGCVWRAGLRAIAEARHTIFWALTKPAKRAGRGQKIRQTPVYAALVH